MKLSKVKRLPIRSETTEPNRIKYEFVTANRIRNFLLFLCFLQIQTLYNKFKNNQKIRKSGGTVRCDKIELVRLRSVRFDSDRFGSIRFDSVRIIRFTPVWFENLLKFENFTVNALNFTIFNYSNSIELS